MQSLPSKLNSLDKQVEPQIKDPIINPEKIETEIFTKVHTEDSLEIPVKIKEEMNFKLLNTSDERTKTISEHVGISKPISESEKLAKKNGAVWTCVGQKGNKEEGFIYEFKILPQNKNWERKNQDIFPAIEMDPYTIMSNLKKFRIEFSELGFKIEQENNDIRCTAYTLFLPDQLTLERRWNILQQQNPALPCIKIASSKGIADDFSFAKAYLEFDALISSGKEFVHDHTVHVIRILNMIFQSAKDKNSSYEEARAIIKDRIQEAVNKLEITENREKLDLENIPDHLKLNADEIENLRKIKKMLGAVVDDLWASNDLDQLKSETIPGNFENYFLKPFIGSRGPGWAHPVNNWGRYLQREFATNNQPLSAMAYDKLMNKLVALWKKMGDIENYCSHFEMNLRSSL